MNLEKIIWGKTKNSETAYLFTITNKNGMIVKISNYGAIIQSLFVSDKNGKIEDVVLGYDNLEDYVKQNPFFGCICGRYCNRISNSSFIIDGDKYILTANEGLNQLHGGFIGFDKVIWETESILNENETRLKMKYLSKDGEEGFPGNLEAEVDYTLTDKNELVIEYFAVTDKTTHVNLTNHTYFNLSADFHQKILDHELWIDSNKFLEADELSIPTGKILNVKNSPFDFSNFTKIGMRINEENDQLKNGTGYDQCFIFNDYNSELKLQVKLYESESGRLMEVLTTEPAVQLYTGNHLKVSYIGKNAIPYKQRTGLCLETEHFPDSPNKPEFPSTILKPGEKYYSKTVYKFSTK
jgi:aldose 1-epimerase